MDSSSQDLLCQCISSLYSCPQCGKLSRELHSINLKASTHLISTVIYTYASKLLKY